MFFGEIHQPFETKKLRKKKKKKKKEKKMHTTLKEDNLKLEYTQTIFQVVQ